MKQKESVLKEMEEIISETLHTVQTSCDFMPRLVDQENMHGTICKRVGTQVTLLMIVFRIKVTVMMTANDKHSCQMVPSF